MRTECLLSSILQSLKIDRLRKSGPIALFSESMMDMVVLGALISLGTTYINTSLEILGFLIIQRKP